MTLHGLDSSGIRRVGGGHLVDQTFDDLDTLTGLGKLVGIITSLIVISVGNKLIYDVIGL